MPLSEFHRATTKKLESAQSKMTTCTSDVSSFMPDHDFVELLWENGQIVMQGQSNRPKKISYPTPFPAHSLRVLEKDGRDPAIQKFSQFEALDTTVNELSPAVPCTNIGLNALDDDMSPWINYPVEDPLCSEFFSELAGISSNLPSSERNNVFAVKDFHNVENVHSSKALRESSEPGRLKSNHMFQLPPPQQCQSLAANGKSRLTAFSVGGSGTNSTHQGQFQKQDLGSGSKNLQGSSGMGLMNFSHFLRPASFPRADTESLGRLKMNEKVSSATASTNPIESTLIESSEVQGKSGLDLHKVEMRSAAKGKGDAVSVKQQRSEAICRDDALRNNHQNNSVVANNNGTSPDRHINCQTSSFAASVAVGRQEAQKGPEPVVASSSVCSGNSAGDTSNDLKHRSKRKNREGEESGYHSEDLDDDSTGLKKPAAGRVVTSTKRSRAAEVHNLSERRRRDRINEKMRALQELIPNCNKVDKASMLDEAIEYLKTLQLQVQMMSMGSGLCMPPMMLPPGMQHLRTPHMAHFSPMGVGVGMGMGLSYGMGMLDMNGSPMIPVPSMHTLQFPCSSIPGATGLHGIPGSTGLQLFGIPGHGQGLPMSVPRALLFSPMSGLAANGSSMNEVSGAMVNPLPVSDGGPSPRCKDQPQQHQSINLESTQKPCNCEPQVAKETFQPAQLLQINVQALQANVDAASNTISDTGNASNR